MPIYPKLSAVFLFLLGCRKIYGYTGRSFIAKMLMNMPCEYYKNSVLERDHIALANLKIYDSNIKNIPLKYYPKFDKTIINRYKPKNKGPYIMVEVSNNRSTSQLNLDKIARVLNRVYIKTAFSVLITAKQTDEEKVITLAHSLTMPSEAYITKNLDEYIGYVDSADIILVGDGGIGHIAGALSKRVVALYGGTSITYWGILGGDVSYLYDIIDVNNIKDELICDALEKHLTAFGTTI